MSGSDPYLKDNASASSHRAAIQARGCETFMADLPLCSLHVMAAGDGPPLVIVPATLSELENWADLVRFMGQWFRSYFFELPGHGSSTPLASQFSSELVAAAVGQLVDHLGAERFNLMGFSFGGILTMKAYALLKERIDRVVLLAPCVTKRAVQLSAVQRLAATQLNQVLQNARMRGLLHKWMRSQRAALLTANFLNLIGRVENKQHMASKLQRLAPSVMEIVSQELGEILNVEFPHPAIRHSTPCYFAMSIRDPLLDYDTTLEELGRHFEDIHVTQLSYPFHQPARPFTFGELNRDFRDTVQNFLVNARVIAA